MAKRKDYQQPTRDELLAMRESKIQAGPISEAARREGSFLRNIVGAGDDLEWILFNQAWTELGFERIGDWWEQRVLPVLVKLDLRPSALLAERVIAAISADEAGLPKVQRRTQREIAAIARTSQSKISRSRPDAPESGSDLENPAAEGKGSPLVDAVRGEIEDVAANQAAAEAASRPADDGGPVPTSPPSAAGTGAFPVGEADRPVPAVTPEPTEMPPPLGDAAGEQSEGHADSAGDETDPETPVSGEVDGQEQQGLSGVSEPAAPGPEQPEELVEGADALPAAPVPHFGDPAALIAWFADRFEEVDADACGPLLAGDDFELIGASLVRISNVVDLLATWPERTQS